MNLNIKIERRFTQLNKRYNVAIIGMGIFGKNHLEVLKKLELDPESIEKLVP